MGHVLESTTLFSSGLLGCSASAFQEIFVAHGDSGQVVNLESGCVLRDARACSRNMLVNITRANDEEGCGKTQERSPGVYSEGYKETEWARR